MPQGQFPDDLPTRQIGPTIKATQGVCWESRLIVNSQGDSLQPRGQKLVGNRLSRKKERDPLWIGYPLVDWRVVEFGQGLHEYYHGFPCSWVEPQQPSHLCSGNIWANDSVKYFLAADTLPNSLPPSNSLPQCRAITLPVIKRVALE